MWYALDLNVSLYFIPSNKFLICFKNELEDIIKKNTDYKIMYKNFELQICYPENCYWYCGYITKFDKN